MAEETATAPQFKIIGSGTHATQASGDSDTDTDTSSLPSGSAEPASPAIEEPANQTSTETPAAEPGSGEPPKVHSATLGSPKPQTASTTNEPAKTPPAAATPPQSITWEEALKAQGFDEQFINMAKVYKTEGNISRYAQAMSTDFSKMPAEDIHRLNLQREYPGATKEDLDLLYQTEILEKYKLDPDSFDPESAAARAGKLKLEMDAKKLRDKFTSENENLKLPSRDVNGELQQQQQAATEKRKALQEELLAHPYSQSVLTDKKLVLKDLSIKDESGKVIAAIPDFTMELADPKEVQAALTDPAVLSKYVLDKDGKYDPQANMQVSAFLTNRIGFMQTLINFGKMLGKEEYVEEKHNPPKLSGTAASPAKESLNEAFATRGKVGKGG